MEKIINQNAKNAHRTAIYSNKKIIATIVSAKHGAQKTAPHKSA